MEGRQKRYVNVYGVTGIACTVKGVASRKNAIKTAILLPKITPEINETKIKLFCRIIF